MKDKKNNLTPLQLKITQENGTEPPFQNAYWDNDQDGIYVDIVSGEPLFSSLEKYDSGSGWPSFYLPLETENIIEKEDLGLASKRIEVRSKKANSHLGHVFDDGPNPTNKRYCINSASLRFIPKENLKEEGYEQFLPLFNEEYNKAIFAGGCFWCIEKVFDQIKGVRKTKVGYIGGKTQNPSYEEVCKGNSGHIEAIQIIFNPKIINYDQILDIFFKNIDPLVKNRQFCDIGEQYKSAVFYDNEEQKIKAQNKIVQLEKLKSWKIETQIIEQTKFWPAEDYHQKFYIKDPPRYNHYSTNCGRIERLSELWR